MLACPLAGGVLIHSSGIGRGKFSQSISVVAL